jgi:hypothetical protein
MASLRSGAHRSMREKPWAPVDRRAKSPPDPEEAPCTAPCVAWEMVARTLWKRNSTSTALSWVEDQNWARHTSSVTLGWTRKRLVKVLQSSGLAPLPVSEGPRPKTNSLSCLV